MRPHLRSRTGSAAADQEPNLDEEGFIIPANRGLFPEGGKLDNLDKALSAKGFFDFWPLGFLEYPLSIPGCWFGVQQLGLGVAPLLLHATAACRSGTLAEAKKAGLLGGTAFGAGCLAWFHLLADEDVTGEEHWFHKQRSNEVLHAALPHVVLGSMRAAKLGHFEYTAALYLTSWHLVQLATEGLKRLFVRTRPISPLSTLRPQLSWQFGKRDVEYPIQEMKNRHDETFSFPSGSAGMAASFSTALVLAVDPGTLLTPKALLPCAVPALLAGFGHLYWRLNYVLDIVVGGALGAGITLLLHRHTEPGWIHVALAHAAYLVLRLPIPRLLLRAKRAMTEECVEL